MRIISGIKKGHQVQAPKKLPVRPTTDFSRENIFNILENTFFLEKIDVLDLFSGTGIVSFEFASRGSKSILSVDSNSASLAFIKKEAKNLGFENFKTIKSDAINFLNKTELKFDIIFADPPYNYNHHKELTDKIFEKEVLKEKGQFILEHSKQSNMSEHQYFKSKRTYGQSEFSFFYKNIKTE
ncbi:MAG: 16S rRNA (guanine(966)-N(2))-methyltransferase RsmD [Bacteroidota bacterium]|nr:16S rRNA (guanine(966)-N(2))-methyltransferase RsmD [Bacteroidota bacterium]